MEIEAQRVRVEAIGQPGQRRFRMLVVVGGETHVAWMEKQQLQALGLALEQMLAQLPEAGPLLGSAAIPVEFDTDTRRQFRVGRMELGYEERSDRIVIIAHDVGDAGDDDDDDDDDPPTLTCAISRDQAREISADAAAVVAAGRPRCTMCGAPMGPGPHACPQQNGHFPRELAGIDEEDDETGG
ncbi:MAG: DUF3090 family protein [Chloroflexia bacterium]|nr:DUF3090 family protein [Chloroflexia bacterium]